MDKNEILEKILDFFRQKGIDVDKESDLENVRYLDRGWLDSFDLIDFITYLESEFEVEIPPEELQKDEFRTIGGVVNVIYNIKNNP
jgi:D-alanine--poly(phosphoribitol) ligase subunit 2